MRHNLQWVRLFVIPAVLLVMVISLAATAAAGPPPMQRKIPDNLLNVQVARIPSPDLLPLLQVATSCGTAEMKTRLDAATPPQFYIKGIKALVYNRGNAASNAGATGTITFYDYRTRVNKSFNFTVGAVAAKGWGVVTPATSSTEEFYVSKTAGITLRVTYAGGPITTPVTHENVEKVCPTMY
jgi:hypothetical protein